MRYLVTAMRGGALMRVLSWVVVIAMLLLFVLLSERGLQKPVRPTATAGATAEGGATSTP
jgi:hypothetical protein